MQNQLLSQYSSADLSVYAVWLPMLAGDAREKWNGRTMADPRVMHFWDGELHIGRWFAQNVDGYDGVAWDIYYLFGPEAVWETIPSPFVGSGQTIFDARQQLQRQISALLEK